MSNVCGFISFYEYSHRSFEDSKVKTLFLSSLFGKTLQAFWEMELFAQNHPTHLSCVFTGSDFLYKLCRPFLPSCCPPVSVPVRCRRISVQAAGAALEGLSRPRRAGQRGPGQRTAHSAIYLAKKPRPTKEIVF